MNKKSPNLSWDRQLATNVSKCTTLYMTLNICRASKEYVCRELELQEKLAGKRP